jgi:Ca-activated chloride channel family protein
MITLHWLRPEWVWSALPILLCLWLHLRQQRSAQQWQHFIDPSLLPHLLEQPQGRYSQRLWPVFLAGLLCWLALMGPSWQRLPSPVLEDRGGLAIVLDLSPSMLAEDLQPSRLQRAKYAIRDLLALRADGQTGLVASAGDAFVVAPLTDDGNTLNTLLPSLHPAMMPVQGSNPLSGLVQAQQLLDNAGSPSGHILLIGDGFSAQQLKGLEGFVDQSSYPVSIIGVGSEQGAPIPLPEGGFLKDSQGNTIVASMPEALMQALARKAGGQYINLSAPRSDSALRKLAAGSQQFEESTQQQTFEQWQDGGQWLAVLLLPFARLYSSRNLPCPSTAMRWTGSIRGKPPTNEHCSAFRKRPQKPPNYSATQCGAVAPTIAPATMPRRRQHSQSETPLTLTITAATRWPRRENWTRP